MADMRTASLGEIVTNLDARRVPLSSRQRAERPGTVPYYGAAGIIDHIDTHLFEGLHLLIGEDGSVVREDGTPYLQLANGEFWVNNHAHVLKGQDDLETRYVFYALAVTDIRGFVTGAVQPKLSQRNMNQIRVPYPDRRERAAIVQTLTALDDKIELNRQMNETLEAMAQAIFRDWFVDFGPVRRKMEGATDPVVIMGGLSHNAGEVASLFPSAVDDGGIPVGWHRKHLGDVATFTKGRSYKSTELQPSNVALVTLKSFLRGGGYRPDGLKPYSGTFRPEQQVVPGDIVMSLTDVTQAADIIGRPAIVSDTGTYRALVASLDVAIIRARVPTELPREFLYQSLRHRHFTEHALAHVTGTTVLHLGKNALPTFPLLVPPPAVTTAFEVIAQAMRDRALANDRENETLAEARDYLLPRLMSGRLHVREREGMEVA